MRVGRYGVRQATRDDVVKIVDLDAGIFGSGMALTRECFEAWLSIFPAGFKVATNRSGDVVGYGMAIRRSADSVLHSWASDTGNGLGTAHEPGGSLLYGVSLASMSPGAGTAICLSERLMVEATSGLNEIWLYGRLRGFSEWLSGFSHSMTTSAGLSRYVSLHIDDVQMFYESVGLTSLRGVEGYLPIDSASLGCAVQTIWEKPSRLR